MTVIWLVVWLICSTPRLEQWNNWAIALAVCLVVDFLSAVSRS